MNIFTKVFKATDVFCGKQRTTIYQRQSAGMIFHMQFIGAVNTTISDSEVWWKGFERTTVEVETDGKVYFSGKIYEFLGMNTDIATIDEYPRNGFSTTLFTKGGKFSGITLNFKIPYYECVKIDLIRNEQDTNKVCYSWITVRDTDEICISYGGFDIPYGTYLHSDKVINTVKSGNEVVLLNTDKSGAIISTSLFGKSTTFNFIEGCLRIYKGKSDIPTLLSSGFEDYFGFCFGFNLGVTQFPLFGDTLHEMSPKSINPYRVSAYRNHTDMPLIFENGGFKLTVRNGDQNTEYMDINSFENMAGDGTGHGDATMGGQITYYTW